MVSGLYSDAIERLDFEGDQLVGRQTIGDSDDIVLAVLFEVPVGYCV